MPAISRLRQTGVSGLLSLALIAALGGQSAVAQSFTQPRANSFAALESRLADHPSLSALGYQAEADRERSVAATALPDPIISVGINNFPLFDPSFDSFIPTNKSIGIRQEFPNRAGRTAESGKARALAEQTDRLRMAQFAALRGELVALLYDKARIARQRDLADARNAKYDELTVVTETEINAGRPDVFRLAEIEVERAGVSRELINLAREDAELEARLIELVGLVPEMSPPPVVPLDWSGEASGFHAVRVAEAAARVADYSVDSARAAWRPDFGAQLTYQQREAGLTFEGDDFASGMVSFTLPLWAGRSQEPSLRAAKADRASAEMRYQAAARTAAARYASDSASWRAAQDNIEVLKRNIAAIEDEIASHLTVYESGAGTYAPVIDGEIAILKLRADIAAEESRRAASIARMNALLVTQ